MASGRSAGASRRGPPDAPAPCERRRTDSRTSGDSRGSSSPTTDRVGTMPLRRRSSVSNAIRDRFASSGLRIATGWPSTRISPDARPRSPKIASTSSVRCAPTSPPIPSTSPRRSWNDTFRNEPATAAVRSRTSSSGLPGVCVRCGNRAVSSRPTIFVMISSIEMVSGRPGPDHLAVTHDRDLVGDPPDLVHLVRDVDDRGALVAEAAKDPEQPVDLLVAQRRGRLVQDDDLRLVRQRPGQLHHLDLRDRQVLGEHPWPDVEADPLEEPARRVRHLSLIDDRDPGKPAGREPPEPDVLHHASGRDRMELLLDHRDACVEGGARGAERDLLPVEDDPPGVRLDQAEEAVHQRRLAGAVLADERVDRSATQAEVDVPERDDARELLVDAVQFERDVVWLLVRHRRGDTGCADAGGMGRPRSLGETPGPGCGGY